MGLTLPLPLVTAMDERDQTLRQRLVTSESKRVGITMHQTRKGYSTSPNSCPQNAVAQRKLTYARRGKELWRHYHNHRHCRWCQYNTVTMVTDGTALQFGECSDFLKGGEGRPVSKTGWGVEW